MTSLFRPLNSLFGPINVPVRAFEFPVPPPQGICLDRLGSRRESMQNVATMRRKPEFPCIFPCYRGFAGNCLVAAPAAAS